MKIEMNNYNILIYNNELKKINNSIKSIYKGDKLYILTDNNVSRLYKSIIIEKLSNFNIEFIIIKDKSFDSYKETISTLIKLGIKRDELIVSLGGGTVGDLAGFVAATLFRGIDYIQIPTTLLAQVDSSIGSKTAIDLVEGKNLIGAFKDPKLVFIDTIFLDTLTDAEYYNGFAEVIKMAITLDEAYYNKLRVTNKLSIDDIKTAINLKKSIVDRDPYDIGIRRVLNFGHTFGHAIETATNYDEYKHGEAVSYGMLMALEVGFKRGITPKYIYEDLKNILLKHNLVKEPLLNYKNYINRLKNDKKNSNKGLSFIFLEDIGQFKISNIEIDSL